jgi:3-phosphoshikimate 1-carboxyvinyltransferase
MLRIVTPLAQMGAVLKGRGEKEYPPLKVTGGSLRAIRYESPISSAQVKSAVLIASLFAEGETIFSEPAKSRDHTERMLRHLGVEFKIEELTIKIRGKQTLKSQDINIPGDISSASFFIALALLKEDSKLTIKDVGINPTRTGLLNILNRMGANIVVKKNLEDFFEPAGDIMVKSSKLKGIEIGGEIIPNIIDEIPIIALIASQAEGKTTIKDAEELRVKESDRITTIVENFKELGIAIEEKKDGFIIYGKNEIKKAKVSSFGDHRIAMTMIIAGLISKQGVEVEDVKCIDTSFPGFLNLIKEIS